MEEKLKALESREDRKCSIMFHTNFGISVPLKSFILDLIKKEILAIYNTINPDDMISENEIPEYFKKNINEFIRILRDPLHEVLTNVCTYTKEGEYEIKIMISQNEIGIIIEDHGLINNPVRTRKYLKKLHANDDDIHYYFNPDNNVLNRGSAIIPTEKGLLVSLIKKIPEKLLTPVINQEKQTVS